MFTGIVEEIGTVKHIQKAANSMQLTITAKLVLEDIHLGDSIAVNGVCLTVISFQTNEFTVDVMPETVKATAIRKLASGTAVNLERAMPANGRFGGHIVSGHVDGAGIILKKRQMENAVYIDFQIPEEVSRYCIEKGSIAIDGTSLTIFKVTSTTMTVSLIPHTYKETVLGMKKERDEVNLECDILGKYVLHQLKGCQQQNITKNLLQQHGF